MIEFHSPTSHSVQKTVVIKMLEIPTGKNCPHQKKPYQIYCLLSNSTKKRASRASARVRAARELSQGVLPDS